MKQELYNDFLISFFDEIDSTNSQLSRDAIKHNMIYMLSKEAKIEYKRRIASQTNIVDI